MYLTSIFLLSTIVFYVSYLNNVSTAYQENYVGVDIATNNESEFLLLQDTVDDSGAYIVKVDEEVDEINIYTDEDINFVSPNFVKEVNFMTSEEIEDFTGEYLVVDYNDQTIADLKSLNYTIRYSYHTDLLIFSILISMAIFIMFLFYSIYDAFVLINQNKKAIFITHISGKNVFSTMKKIDYLNYKLIVLILFLFSVIFVSVTNQILYILLLLNIVFYFIILIIRYIVIYIQVLKAKKDSSIHKLNDTTNKGIQKFLKLFKFFTTLVTIIIFIVISLLITNSFRMLLFYQNANEDLGQYGYQQLYFPNKSEQANISEFMLEFNSFTVASESVDYVYYSYSEYTSAAYSGPIVQIDQDLASKYIPDAKANTLYIPSRIDNPEGLISQVQSSYNKPIDVVYEDVKIPNYSVHATTNEKYLTDTPVLIVDEEYIATYSSNFNGTRSSLLIKYNDYDQAVIEMNAQGIDENHLTNYSTYEQRLKVQIKNAIIFLVLEILMFIFIILLMRKLNTKIVLEDINNNIRSKLIQRLGGKEQSVIFKNTFRLNYIIYIVSMIIIFISVIMVKDFIYTLIISVVTIIYLLFDYIYFEKLCRERLDEKIVDYLKGRK
jgi:hypothetical protein